MIEDELECADEYIETALKCKDENPELAKLMYSISLQELEHMEKLHKAVVEIIEKYRKENGEPPQAMMAVYDYLHRRHIERATKIKIMQNMF